MGIIGAGRLGAKTEIPDYSRGFLQFTQDSGLLLTEASSRSTRIASRKRLMSGYFG